MDRGPLQHVSEFDVTVEAELPLGARLQLELAGRGARRRRGGRRDGEPGEREDRGEEEDRDRAHGVLYFLPVTWHPSHWRAVNGG